MRRGLPATVARVGAAAMVLVSGGYLVLYLYRWEWNRAIVAGIFFLGAEVALVAMVLLDRLAAVPPPRVTAPPGPGSHAGQTATPVGPRFPWLEPDRFSVFVPVLLGAGMLLSLVAWLVERIAALTAPTGRSRLLAGVGGGSGIAAAPVAARPRRTAGWWLLRAVALGAAVVVLAVGLQTLADLAQARDDPPRAGFVLVVDLEIETRRATPPVVHLAEELRVLCVPPPFASELTMTGARTARLEIDPAPGRTDRRKILGCLQDLRVDRTLARVRSAVEVEVGQPAAADASA